MTYATDSIEFSAIEARVVRLAASHHERASRGPSRGPAAIDKLLGRSTPLTLADPRLEALRNQAVRLRDGGGVQPEFLAAGFTPAHADRIADVMRIEARRNSPKARRDRAAYTSGITLALGSFASFLGLTAALVTQP